MKMKQYINYLIVTGIAMALMTAGVIAEDTPSSTSDISDNAGPNQVTPVSFGSFKNYPDHGFNVKEYILGMKKGGHNLLIWKDPAVNLSQYRSVKITEFGSQFLPEQNIFSYEPYLVLFNTTFRTSLKLPQGESPDSLIIEGSVVECNPGSRAARAWVGFGAGKAGGAVVCEVYEPGKPSPCIRIYTRDTGSSGNWGGNSVAMLNNIFSQLGIRLATILNTTAIR